MMALLIKDHADWMRRFIGGRQHCRSTRRLSPDRLSARRAAPVRSGPARGPITGARAVIRPAVPLSTPARSGKIAGRRCLRGGGGKPVCPGKRTASRQRPIAIVCDSEGRYKVLYFGWCSQLTEKALLSRSRSQRSTAFHSKIRLLPQNFVSSSHCLEAKLGRLP